MIAAFRGTAGSDSQMYINAYNFGTDSISRWVDFEPGFKLVVQVLNKLNLPYHAMFFTFSFLSAVVCIKAMDLEKDIINVKVAAFIYITDLYFWGFNGIRQMIAVSIYLLAIPLYLRNRKLISVFLILLAAAFHFSAFMGLITIIIYEVYKSKYKKQLFAIGAVALIILITKRDFLGGIIDVLTGNTYYSGYITRDAETGTTLFNYYIKLCPILVIPILTWKKIITEKKAFMYFSLMVFGIVLSSLGAVTATQVSRLGMYFSMCEIFTLAYCANYKLPVRIGNSMYGKKMTEFIIIFYFVLFFYYSYFIRGFSQLVPYGLFG